MACKPLGEETAEKTSMSILEKLSGVHGMRRHCNTRGFCYGLWGFLVPCSSFPIRQKQRHSQEFKSDGARFKDKIETKNLI